MLPHTVKAPPRGWGFRTRLLLTAIAAVFFMSLLIGMYPVSNCDCDDVLYGPRGKDLVLKAKQHFESQLAKVDVHQQLEEYLKLGDHPDWGPHKLCVIVPLKDRFEELLEFLPHIHRYLNAQQIRHRVLFINQVDVLRFNRASLINVGFLQSQADCDYMAMHDVDLLPLNMNLNYAYPEKGPFHVAAPHLHPKYHYSTFVGGILLLQHAHFRLVKGMSNKFWGWGREDDELYVRMKQANLTIHRPGNLTTNSETTFRHVHEKQVRPRDYKRYGNQRKVSKKRDYDTGVDTVKYKIIDEYDMNVSGASGTVYNVELLCDVEVTSWCMRPEQLEEVLQGMQKDHQEAREHVANAQGQILAAETNMQAAREKLQHDLNVARGNSVHADPVEENAIDARNAQQIEPVAQEQLAPQVAESVNEQDLNDKGPLALYAKKK